MKTETKLSRRQFVKGVAASTLLAAGVVPLCASSTVSQREETVELTGT